MVKKRLASGEPCRKCVQTEEMLRGRGLWERIDDVVWAEEGDASSPGMKLAAELGVETAPFFIVDDEAGRAVYKSALSLIRERLGGRGGQSSKAAKDSHDELMAMGVELAEKTPQEILAWALERYRDRCAIAFSGSDDVVLIDMAVELKLPFSVITVDTGRLHPETLEFVDQVRQRYGCEIHVTAPDAADLEPFVREKGLFSFYEDGHQECCAIRKVAPLRRALAKNAAWVTGQRRDQNPDTRSDLPVLEEDKSFGTGERPLVKLNPLASWSAREVWDYIRDRDLPFNPLHARGFASIGCAPCTRAILPGQPERAGRWWWEDTASKECGLHTSNLRGEKK